MNEQFNQIPQAPVEPQTPVVPQAPVAPAAPQKNGLATAGMVLGIIGAVCIFSFFYAPAALEKAAENFLNDLGSELEDSLSEFSEEDLQDAFAELEDALADIDLDSIS